MFIKEHSYPPHISLVNHQGFQGDFRTLAGLSRWVAAVGTNRLLDVEGAAACMESQRQTSASIFVQSKYPSYSPSSPAPSICGEICDSALAGKADSGKGGILTTTPAQSVRLVVALAKARGTLRCDGYQFMSRRCRGGSQ